MYFETIDIGFNLIFQYNVYLKRGKFKLQIDSKQPNAYCFLD